MGRLQVTRSQEAQNGDSDLEFHDLPPFPEDVPVAPLLRISLNELLGDSERELDRFWKASRELGFFYLDLRDACGDSDHVDSPVEDDTAPRKHMMTSSVDDGSDIIGQLLLENADTLFDVGEKIFDLSTEEKIKYDLKDKGSYYGYKGYGAGQIDAEGTKDRNEFHNVSKDDILSISEPLPAPELLTPHRGVLRSFIEQSHAVVSFLLRLLNTRLGLPSGTLPSLHRLQSVSGDQVRWVYAPSQPFDDRKVALGQHTDFGSITVLFNRLGGLQVLPPGSKEWCYVKPLRGHAIVNLGDAMVKFTAGVLRSNTHRVISPPGQQADMTRMSLVYFSRPEDDVLLKVLEGSPSIDEKRGQMEQDENEEVVTSKEWILRRALGRRQGGNWTKAGGTEGGRLHK